MMSNQRIRIGIDGREFTERETGISRLLSGALQELCRQRPEWDFLLFGNQRTVLPFTAEPLTLFRIPERVTLWWDQITLPSYLKKEKIDLFLSPYYKIPIFAPCPVMNILHDLIIVTSDAYRSPRYFFRKGVYYALGQLYARRSQLIVTDSSYSKQCIQKIFNVPEGKIQVIYPGLAVNRAGGQKEAFESLCQKYPLRRPYLLYVGNFKPHKRVDCLLEAYALLPKELRDHFGLVLAGDLGSHGSEIKRLAEKLGLGDRVCFTDYVEEASLSALYQNAHLFVFPSSAEGFGLPPLEAMAFGVPVIATRAASVPEVAGDAAILVSPGSAEELSTQMARLLRDEALRQSLIRKGKERASFFSIESQTQKILSVMEQLLDQKQ